MLSKVLELIIVTVPWEVTWTKTRDPGQRQSLFVCFRDWHSASVLALGERELFC